MAKKLITVFGATGRQGGSVVKIFLNDSKLKDEWSVRGVTRDVTKDSSKKLAEKGVEVVAADMEDKASLVKAMQGSYAVFAATNYWEKMDKDLEIQQGKNLADAAAEAGVKHFILQTLLDVTKLSKGALPDVYHFDSKAEVESYVRNSIGMTKLPTTFFLPGFFMTNFSEGMIRPTSDDPSTSPWILAMPVPETAPVPVFDVVADTGKYVKGIVLKGDAVVGKQVYAASDYLSFKQIIETFQKVFPETGKRTSFVQTSHEQFKGALTGQGMPDFAAEELTQNMRLLHEFGYYGGAPLSTDVVDESDTLTTWEEFVRNAPAWKSLK